MRPLGGLALGEFEPGEEEVIEEDSDGQTHHAVVGSGAIARSTEPYNSDSQLTPRNASRRRAVHSLSSYESDSAGVRTHSMDEARMVDHSDAQSGLYSYDESEEHEVFDGDGELNAVYLKRNADFHTLFRNIPINELLIDDYGCALQRDILVQGRLYLTENFVCFYSNIFGWVTNLVIDIDEIVAIEKKMTALIIPNAIQVSTLHSKYFFGSFIYRDSAYNQLIDLWGKSRNEKNAGLPEIGHAEGGDGAGDVSRHRGDVLTAYQSLSEDDEEEEEEDQSGSEYSNGNSSDTEDSASEALDNDDTEEKQPPAEGTAGQVAREAPSDASQAKVVPAVIRTQATDAGSANEGSVARTSDHDNAGNKSATEPAAASSVQNKTGNGTPASVTRPGRHSLLPGPQRPATLQ
ncbi:GRAM-domain-containing protein [Linderina pennispora]|uniref:GRAM-domain-containing protein n=1 Tax=Linderina pennispora TaxID=61395 RepID=A0A1Y1WBD8_9FUNG|nr:GRAM-domain-containing protein [Linderina pennispora]ORX70859.1 GRAM-domain-containing protein [Linderina pennispora]